jgi:hypothetical protein
MGVTYTTTSAATYVPIATQDMAGIATVTFSSLGSYTDIVIVGANLTRGTANSTFFRLNGDTASNYSWTKLAGNGSAASASTSTAQNTGILANATGGLGSTVPTMFVAHLMNYANATTYKTLLSRDTDANATTEAFVNLWRSTSAITSITVYTGGNFTTGNVTLYGILGA